MSDEIIIRNLETSAFMVSCPNGCGALTVIEKPQSVGLMLPEEVEELLPPLELENYPTLRAVCPKCGFVALEPPEKPEIQYESPFHWNIKEPEEEDDGRETPGQGDPGWEPPHHV